VVHRSARQRTHNRPLFRTSAVGALEFGPRTARLGFSARLVLYDHSRGRGLHLAVSKKGRTPIKTCTSGHLAAGVWSLGGSVVPGGRACGQAAHKWSAKRVHSRGPPAVGNRPAFGQRCPNKWLREKSCEKHSRGGKKLRKSTSRGGKKLRKSTSRGGKKLRKSTSRGWKKVAKIPL
jgi:hypothetical protein